MKSGKETKVSKIVISPQHELTDLIREITRNRAERIQLVFAEQSDMLVSPINLKVLLESADEEGKALIAQILQNQSGLNNAIEAGFLTIASSEEPDEDLWLEAEAVMKERKTNRERTLKNLQKRASPNHKAVTTSLDENEEEVISEQDTVPAAERNMAFKDTIDQALAKSKEGLNKPKNRVVESSGVTFALDGELEEELPSENPTSSPNSSNPSEAASSDKNSPKKLVGYDFSGNERTRSDDEQNGKVYLQQESMRVSKDMMNINRPRRSTGSKKFDPKQTLAKILLLLKSKNSKNLALRIVLPLITIFALIAWYIYSYTPLINVELFIESRAVSVEKTFTGAPTITEFNLELLQIQTKKEAINKERSDSTNATGTAERGNRAEGFVTVKCFLDEVKILPAGTVVKSGNFEFSTKSELTLNCPTSISVGVEAKGLGAEYNLPSGTAFTVTGYTNSQMNAVNDSGAFTGGTKETYTVVSQADIDRVTNTLKDAAFAEAKNELTDKSTEGWEIIESTVVNELDGAVTSDFPVGAETDIINISLKTKSSAIFYKKADLTDSEESILLQEAESKNLFESEDDMDLNLDDEIQSTISVESVEGDTVKIKLLLSGSVKPTVDRSKIEKDLGGKSWDEGIKYLGNLKFVAADTNLSFSPTYFPESLRYFPAREGRILIKVTEIEQPLPAEGETENVPAEGSN